MAVCLSKYHIKVCLGCYLQIYILYAVHFNDNPIFEALPQSFTVCFKDLGQVRHDPTLCVEYMEFMELFFNPLTRNKTIILA